MRMDMIPSWLARLASPVRLEGYPATA